MMTPAVVSRREWKTAHAKLLAEEKELDVLVGRSVSNE